MTRTPFDEPDYTEYLEKNIIRYCPYCGAVNKSYCDDYHEGMTPLQDTLYVTWICEEETFCGTFKTEHELDHEGQLKRPWG